MEKLLGKRLTQVIEYFQLTLLKNRKQPKTQMYAIVSVVVIVLSLLLFLFDFVSSYVFQ